MAKATAHPDHRLISSEDPRHRGRFCGFLGLAHSHYPIPWSGLKYDTALGGNRTGPRDSSRMLRSSATILGLIVTGRDARMSTTEHRLMGDPINLHGGSIFPRRQAHEGCFLVAPYAQAFKHPISKLLAHTSAVGDTYVVIGLVFVAVLACLLLLGTERRHHAAEHSITGNRRE
jgi:hypothetical protein